MNKYIMELDLISKPGVGYFIQTLIPGFELNLATPRASRLPVLHKNPAGMICRKPTSLKFH